MTVLAGFGFGDPGFIVPLALVQAVILLLVIWLLDYYEREPLGNIALMALWGGTLAPAIVISLRDPVLHHLNARHPVTVAMVSALVEEPVKAVALVAAFGLSYLAARHFGILEFEGVTDGLVYGAAIGLGFAFTEDIFFLVQQGSITEGLSVFHSRANFLGINMLAHAVYTGTVGAAIGAATWERSKVTRVFYPIIGLGLAVIMHATHNGLEAAGHRSAVRAVDFLFIVMFFGGMALWLSHQQRILRSVLAEERDWGLITEAEWHHTTELGASLRKEWALLKAGDLAVLRTTRALQSELVELGFATWRLRRLGIAGLWQPLERRRETVRKLQAELAEQRAETAELPEETVTVAAVPLTAPPIS